jgi:proline iminopeptidase
MRLRQAAVWLALAWSAGACGKADDELPSWEGSLPINGTELYVKRLGAGEPIVVVHGGPVLEHGYLLPHLAPLAESYELIFFDQRLSGRSAPRVDSASVRLATFVDDIEGLRQSLGLDHVHLMGHSWGGLLAIHYALEHQEHLISLVLLNSMSPSSDLWQEEERLLADRITAADSTVSAAVRASEAFEAREPEAIRQLLLLSFKTQFHDPNSSSDLGIYVPDDYMARSRQFGYMMVDLASFDLRAELNRVTVPTLVIYGSDEPAVSLGGTALHEGIQNVEFVIIENAGHFPFIEQPEVFLSAVRRFLEAQR